MTPSYAGAVAALGPGKARYGHWTLIDYAAGAPDRTVYAAVGHPDYAGFSAEPRAGDLWPAELAEAHPDDPHRWRYGLRFDWLDPEPAEEVAVGDDRAVPAPVRPVRVGDPGEGGPGRPGGVVQGAGLEGDPGPARLSDRPLPGLRERGHARPSASPSPTAE